jgi:hypothetical protein
MSPIWITRGSDLKIISFGGGKFKVHKAVIKDRCPVLARKKSAQIRKGRLKIRKGCCKDVVERASEQPCPRTQGRRIANAADSSSDISTIMDVIRPRAT